jgi:hypothetical protein
MLSNIREIKETPKNKIKNSRSGKKRKKKGKKRNLEGLELAIKLSFGGPSTPILEQSLTKL